MPSKLSNSATHYDILSLPASLRSAATMMPQTLRSAYRRALLQNHPDKSLLPSSKALPTAAPSFTIDQITTAFEVLSNPKARAKYDAELLLRGDGNGRRGQEAGMVGVETADLDDLVEGDGLWTRSCRCGEDEGFVVTERDLEDALVEDASVEGNGGKGEVLVGCRGCSLWLRVLFGVVEEEPEAVMDAQHTDAVGGRNMG